MTINNSSRGGCSRRQALRSLVGGSLLFPAIVSDLLAVDSRRDNALDPLTPKLPHLAASAKRVIFLYMSGGVSHVDSFDPKPKLQADHGKEWPGGVLKKSLWEARRYGRSGIEVSDLFPAMGSCVDDLCVIRSMRGDHGNHFEATLGLHTGSGTVTRPSIGSWVSYGLGTLNQNLPAFVVVAPHLPYAGGQVWGADFLPACHQGTRVTPGGEPVPNLTPQIPRTFQELELASLRAMNLRHLAERGDDSRLSARLRSFETAFGMQMEAPEAFDLSSETAATKALYGLNDRFTKGFAWQCLVARRLVERGVRFVEVIDSGASNNWDSHGDMADHERLARGVDRPIAGLIKDLKSRGMLEDTLVVWTTEFGRTPVVSKLENKGREHHSAAFSSWLAGGGVKAGITHGSSDDYGIRTIEDEVHTNDFHATILHLLGLDHQRLIYRHAGRDFRLTDVKGNVVKRILA